jgi:hypothetical protein
MQPDRNQIDEQPPEQPSVRPPYVADPSTTERPVPVVTLAPESAPESNSGILQPSDTPLLPGEEREEEPVRWQAYEYIHHEKSPVWFVLFALVVLGLIAAAIFLLESITFAILVPVMAATLLVYNHRPPRLIDYTLSRHGLHINDHLYPFNEFKGFRVVHDGEEYSVMLLPIKRFKPGVSVYFPEEAGEAIVDMLGARLPMQDFHQDTIDKIIRKLRI